MPGDYSRFRDITGTRFAALLMQQGRVQLDSDFNELVDILTTRDRLQALDTFGHAAVPRETSRDAFKLTPAGNDNLVIGNGRMYVDGLLVESFPPEPSFADPDSYLHQPFYPDPYALTHLTGDALVYLDVWQREITAIEDPSLLDPALGDIDTTTRLQTVWQIKYRPSTPHAPLTCGSRGGTPSAGRLTVTPAPTEKLPDLCEPPDTPGFYDIENRHYRVQIHDVVIGNLARYKFSREGGSVVSRVTNVETITVGTKPVTRLTVDRIGRDAVLRFTPLDWVELMDDVAAVTTMAGSMAQVTDVDEDSQTITLDRPLSGVTLANHPRLILWDQHTGADKDGLLWVKPGETVPLERGLAVTFTLDPPDYWFHPGDYWLFPARVADPMATPLDRAKPLPEHHFASLGMISRAADGTLSVLEDCRVLWPDCDCACAACVTPESHNPGGWLSIQQAIAKVKKKGGGTICVHPGVYLVAEPIIIEDASAITIVGLGNVFLLPVFITFPMFVIRHSKNIAIENLVLSSGGAFFDLSELAIVTIVDCDGPITLSRNLFFSNVEGPPIGVKLSGELAEVYLLRNAFETGVGVDCDANNLTIVDARVRDNVFLCKTTGVRLSGNQVAADISNNTIVQTAVAGIAVKGTVASAGAISICGNSIETHGDGIVASTSDVHIANNSISRALGDPPVVSGGGLFTRPGGGLGGFTGGSDTDFIDGGFSPLPIQSQYSAIWLKPETGPVSHSIAAIQPIPFAFRPVRCHVLANRIVEFRGNGIRLSGSIISAMIKQNFITHVDVGGIVMDGGTVAEQLSIENNEIYETGQNVLNAADDASAIRTSQVTTLHILANRIERARDHGIRLAGIANGMIKNNVIRQVGSAGIFMEEGAGFEEVSIENNQIARTGRTPSQPEGSGIRTASVTNLAVRGNHINLARDHGIRLSGAIGGAMIQQNFITHVDVGGIVMDEGASAEKLSIENNQIFETGQNVLNAGDDGSAIRTWQVTTLHILANRIERARDHGIYLAGLANGMIENNFVRQVGSGGIFMDNGAGAEELSIENNQITRTGRLQATPEGSGIRAANVATLAVRCNHVSLARDHGIRLSGAIAGAMIQQNFITHVDVGGIVMDENATAEKLSIENNQIFETGQNVANAADDASAIRTRKVTTLHILANRIERARDHGIRMGTIAQGMLKHNFIRQVGSGGIFMEPGASAEQLSIENNQIALTGRIQSFPNGSGIHTANVTSLAVLANHINDVRDHGIRLSWILDAMIKQNAINVAGAGGIIMDANPDPNRRGARVSIANNQISHLGGNSPAAPLSAIRVESVQDASITDNQINRTHSLQGSVETIACRAFESAQISGNSIAGSAATSRNSSDFTLTGNRARVMSNAVRREGGTKGKDVDFCVLFANDIGTLIAGSNEWVTIGSLKAPMVFIGRSTHCTFADNVFTTVNNSLNDAILRIHAENSLIVTSNRAQGGTGVAFDLAPSPKPPLFRWTILGNIVDGDIFINGQALTAPWLALNHLIQGNTQDPIDPNIDNNNTVA